MYVLNTVQRKDLPKTFKSLRIQVSHMNSQTSKACIHGPSFCWVLILRTLQLILLDHMKPGTTHQNGLGYTSSVRLHENCPVHRRVCNTLLHLAQPHAIRKFSNESGSLKAYSPVALRSEPVWGPLTLSLSSRKDDSNAHQICEEMNSDSNLMDH